MPKRYTKFQKVMVGGTGVVIFILSEEKVILPAVYALNMLLVYYIHKNRTQESFEPYPDLPRSVLLGLPTIIVMSVLRQRRVGLPVLPALVDLGKAVLIGIGLVTVTIICVEAVLELTSRLRARFRMLGDEVAGPR